jgi:hypothetical protein
MVLPLLWEVEEASNRIILIAINQLESRIHWETATKLFQRPGLM